MRINLNLDERETYLVSQGLQFMIMAAEGKFREFSNLPHLSTQMAGVAHELDTLLGYVVSTTETARLVAAGHGATSDAEQAERIRRRNTASTTKPPAEEGETT